MIFNLMKHDHYQSGCRNSVLSDGWTYIVEISSILHVYSILLCWKGTAINLLFYLCNYSLVVMKLVNWASYYWGKFDLATYHNFFIGGTEIFCSTDVQAQGIYEMIFFIIIKNLRSLLMAMMRNVRILWTWVSRLWGKVSCLTFTPTEMLFQFSSCTIPFPI